MIKSEMLKSLKKQIEDNPDEAKEIMSSVQSDFPCSGPTAKEYLDYANRLHPLVLYTALYNPSTCESAPATISIHRTKLGAYRAIRKSKEEIYERWLESHRWRKSRYNSKDTMRLHSDRFKFDFDQWWGIGELEILD